ncbi:MAG: hypothetical protein AAFQ82_10000, partial [Myxococcota bacterium]
MSPLFALVFAVAVGSSDTPVVYGQGVPAVAKNSGFRAVSSLDGLDPTATPVAVRVIEKRSRKKRSLIAQIIDVQSGELLSQVRIATTGKRRKYRTSAVRKGWANVRRRLETTAVATVIENPAPS